MRHITVRKRKGLLISRTYGAHDECFYIEHFNVVSRPTFKASFLRFNLIAKDLLSFNQHS